MEFFSILGKHLAREIVFLLILPYEGIRYSLGLCVSMAYYMPIEANHFLIIHEGLVRISLAHLYIFAEHRFT